MDRLASTRITSGRKWCPRAPCKSRDFFFSKILLSLFVYCIFLFYRFPSIFFWDDRFWFGFGSGFSVRLLRLLHLPLYNVFALFPTPLDCGSKSRIRGRDRLMMMTIAIHTYMGNAETKMLEWQSLCLVQNSDFINYTCTTSTTSFSDIELLHIYVLARTWKLDGHFCDSTDDPVRRHYYDLLL